MDDMNRPATKKDLEEAIRASTRRASVMIGLMVAALLVATYIMARAL